MTRPTPDRHATRLLKPQTCCGKKKPRVQRSQPDPLAPAISGEGIVGNTRQRVRVQTQQLHAVGPTEFGSEPLDSQQFILGAAQAGAQGAKHRDTSTIQLDQEHHPASGAQRAPSHRRPRLPASRALAHK